MKNSRSTRATLLKKDLPEAVILNQWLSDHPAAPKAWRTIAERLESHEDMPDAWKSLRRRGGQAMPVFADTSLAWTQAFGEVSRPIQSKKSPAIERVQKLARELKDASEDSPFLQIGRRKTPETQAFVRWLTTLFAERFHAEMHAVVACIATAVLSRDSPIDKSMVEGFLKDAPREFRLRKAPLAGR